MMKKAIKNKLVFVLLGFLVVMTCCGQAKKHDVFFNELDKDIHATQAKIDTTFTNSRGLKEHQSFVCYNYERITVNEDVRTSHIHTDTFKHSEIFFVRIVNVDGRRMAYWDYENIKSHSLLVKSRKDAFVSEEEHAVRVVKNDSLTLPENQPFTYDMLEL